MGDGVFISATATQTQCRASTTWPQYCRHVASTQRQTVFIEKCLRADAKIWGGIILILGRVLTIWLRCSKREAASMKRSPCCWKPLSGDDHSLGTHIQTR